MHVARHCSAQICPPRPPRRFRAITLLVDRDIAFRFRASCSYGRRSLHPRIEARLENARVETSVWRERERVFPLLFVSVNILIGRGPRRVIYRLTMLAGLAINYVVLRYFI